MKVIMMMLLLAGSGAAAEPVHADTCPLSCVRCQEGINRSLKLIAETQSEDGAWLAEGEKMPDAVLMHTALNGLALMGSGCLDARPAPPRGNSGGARGLRTRAGVL